MPFLRAALLKKKPDTEPEAIKAPEPFMEAEAEPVVEIVAPVVIEEVEEEPEAFTDFAALHKVIDEKAEPEPEPVIFEEVPAQEPEPMTEEPQEIPEEPEEPQEVESEAEPELEQAEPEAEAVEQAEPEITPEEPFKLQYDFTSGERYVDKVSTKTEFDKMLDELAAISKDLLSWEVEKFAKKYTGKFPGEGDKSEADAKKYEAFLGGYITNAAMTLYDNGYRDAAIKQLEQAKNILIARKKLEDETLAIKERVEEEDAAVDLSDILGMFGDG